MKDLIKDFIFTKWAEAGFEPKDIKHIMSNICLVKKAEGDETESIPNFLFSTVPLALFSIPALGGALFYNFTTPNITAKNKLKKKQKELLEKELEDLSEGRNFTVSDYRSKLYE